MTTLLALAIVGCAATAAVVSPAAGASGGGATADDSSSRVFYIVYGDSRSLFADPDDDGPDDPNGPNFTGEGDGGFDSSDEFDDPTQEAHVSIPEDSWGRLNILQLAGMAGGASSYEQAMSDLELPFMFAGREQWVRNLAGVGVGNEPRLWDVTMESVQRDESARYLLLGRAAYAADRGLSGAGDLSYWQSLVPSWAPRVRDELAKKGVPFSVELLADPDINISDPTKPLFVKGSTPLALFSLGVLQKGENTFLRSLSAEELMLEVWPAYYRYYHRAAGAPVPAELRAGMSFGSPVLLDDGTYLRSPMMKSSPYQRWARYGYPGSYTSDPAKSTAALDAILERDEFFLGEYQLFAPSSLDAAVIQRYQTLAAGG